MRRIDGAQVRRLSGMSGRSQEWLASLKAHWPPLEKPGLGANVWPVSVDTQRRLHLEAATPAWRTTARLLAKDIAAWAGDLVGEGGVTGVIVRKDITRLPVAVSRRWPDLIGRDLADSVLPLQILEETGQLVTVADTAADRETALERAPETLRRIRELLGSSCPVKDWAPSILRPVAVLVVGCSDWNNRDLVEDVLLETWHDAVQLYGPENSFVIEHTSDNAPAGTAHLWAERLCPPFSVAAFAHLVDVTADDREQAEAERDQDLLDQHPDLCLAFVTREEAAPPLLHRAQQAGIPCRVIVSPRLTPEEQQQQLARRRA